MDNNFEYLRPESAEEACELKAKYGSKAKYLAGGSDLLLKLRSRAADFNCFIDLTFIRGLNFIDVSENMLRIGTLTTLADIENASPDNSLIACLGTAAKQMCTPQTRNYATVGGNLCNASPAADMSVVFTALNAKLRVLGMAGEREVSVDTFFTGVSQTQLDENELVTEISVPVPTLKTEAAFGRSGRTGVDIAQVNAAVSLSVEDNGIIATVRIAMGAVAPVPIRSQAAEQMLLGMNISGVDQGLLEKVSVQAAADAKPITDIRASAAYRKEITKVLVRRCLEEIMQKIVGDRS